MAPILFSHSNVLSFSPIARKPVENWNQCPIIRPWEIPIQSPASRFRDPVSRIAQWLQSQDPGKSFKAIGRNLIRLKLAAEQENARLGYRAYSISHGLITKRNKQ